MNNISLAGRSAFKYMSEHIFQSLTPNQLNLIKKIGVIASLAIGVAAGIYIFYKVSSCLFAKSFSNNEEDSDAKSLKIDLERVKEESFPVKHSPDITPKKESSKTDKTHTPSFLKKSDLEESNQGNEDFNAEDLFIDLDDKEDILPTPQSSPSKSPKSDPSSQPYVASVLIPVVQPKSQQQIDLELEFSLLCDEATNLYPPRSVMLWIVQKFNDKPAKAIELIDVALAQGIAIDICGKKGKTSLYYAKNVDLVHHLIDCGANPNAQNIEGRTPLHCARKIDIVKVLFDRGARLDISDKKGITILEEQMDGYIKHPNNNERQEIVEFLIAIDAKLSLTDNTGKLLDDSLVHGILYPEHLLSIKAFLFQIAEKLVQFVPLPVCDPQGTLLILAFEKLINDYSTVWDFRRWGFPYPKDYNTLLDDQWVQYYLNVADKLAKMGSVRLNIADPKGKLLYLVINDAISQNHNHKPSFLDPYLKVADKLIELGASFAISDPHGEFIEKVIRFSIDISEPDFHLAIAKQLLLRGETLKSDQILKINQEITSRLDRIPNCKEKAKQMIEAGLPDEIEIHDKTLAEWKKEI